MLQNMGQGKSVWLKRLQQRNPMARKNSRKSVMPMHHKAEQEIQSPSAAMAAWMEGPHHGSREIEEMEEDLAMGQNLRYLFGDDYPPKIVYFKGF